MNNLPEETLYYLAFNLCWEVIGPSRFPQILKYFKSVKAAWLAPDDEYRKFLWGEETLIKFFNLRKNVNLTTAANRVTKSGVRLLTLADKDYPANLRKISDPPFLLYVHGNLQPRDDLALAIVGSRKMTSYGADVIKSLVPDLTAGGLTIVSGLAFGVDYLAHKVALEAGGRVIAVLASGVDIITPRTNEGLAEEIVKSGRGAVVSEFPLGTEPKDYYFPFRNRVISGLSKATLVIEAAEQSGTFHTVRAALDQGRGVFAVPGPIFNPLSRGPLKLIRDGAKPVASAQDILEELADGDINAMAAARESLPENELESAMMEALESGEKQLDQLVEGLKKNPAEILSALTGLELKGMVKNIGDGVYRST